MISARLHSWFGPASLFYWRCQRGAAAAEFALLLSLLVIPILNVVDFGIYVYQGMELNNAGQAAVQEAWALCATAGKVPATVGSNCPGLTTAMTAAAQSTPLGTAVTITLPPAENYCCPSSSGPLSCEGPVATTQPATCSSGDPPGDYIQATVSYTYTPLFTGVSLVSLLPTPITRVASMRLA